MKSSPVSSGLGEEQDLSNKPKGSLRILRSETDLQSTRRELWVTPRHIIRCAFDDARVILSPIGCGRMIISIRIPVRRQADPSPPTLKPQEFILIKGLLVL